MAELSLQCSSRNTASENRLDGALTESELKQNKKDYKAFQKQLDNPPPEFSKENIKTTLKLDGKVKTFETLALYQLFELRKYLGEEQFHKIYNKVDLGGFTPGNYYRNKLAGVIESFGVPNVACQGYPPVHKNK